MHVQRVLRYAAVSLGILIAAACGDSASSTAPAITDGSGTADLKGGNGKHNKPVDQAPQPNPLIPPNLVLKRTVELESDIVATTTVTSAGAWLAIEQAGLIVYFPPGAVSSDLLVTVTANKGGKVVYTFEPHGTQFATPIYVAQLLLNTEVTVTGDKIRPPIWAGYLANGLADIAVDGTGAFAETFDAFLWGRGTEAYTVFATTHFSGYALASGKRETTGSGGY